jgi:hypothetical protein
VWALIVLPFYSNAPLNFAMHGPSCTINLPCIILDCAYHTLMFVYFSCMLGCICFFSVDVEYEESVQEFYYPLEDHVGVSTSNLTGEPFSLYPFYILLSLYILALCYDALFESRVLSTCLPKAKPYIPTYLLLPCVC